MRGNDESVSKLRLLGEIFGVFAVYFGATFFVTFAAVVLAVSLGVEFSEANLAEDENLNFIAFLSLPFASALLLVVVKFMWGRRGLSWSNFGLFRPVRWGQTWLQGIGLAVLVLVLSAGLGLFLENLGLQQDLATFNFISGNTLAFIYMATVVSWFAAAFTEEVVFRGYVMGNLANLFGGSNGAWVLAVILQGALFGSLHLYQDVSGGIIAGVIGMVFGFAYWKFRNLWPVIIAHGLIDTIGMTIFYLGLEEIV